MVIFIFGFTGSGKSTLAKYISKKFNFYYYDSDLVKRKVFILDPKYSENIAKGLPFSAKTRAKMYEWIIKDLHKLKKYQHIVIDDTLHTSLLRNKLLSTSKKLFGKYLLIQTLITNVTAKTRLSKKRKGHMLTKSYNVQKLQRKSYKTIKSIDLKIDNNGNLKDSKKRLDTFINNNLN